MWIHEARIHLVMEQAQRDFYRVNPVFAPPPGKGPIALPGLLELCIEDTPVVRWSCK